MGSGVPEDDRMRSANYCPVCGLLWDKSIDYCPECPGVVLLRIYEWDHRWYE